MMGAEKQRIKVPADNYGRVYIGLLETPLSAYAKLCYGVMWSFGQESWASLASIGRRMSVSKPTVIKAQAELAAAGWIVLVEDSKGRTTKVWEMRPPTVNVADFNGKGDLPLTVNAVDPKKELKQEEKQEGGPSKSKTDPTLEAKTTNFTNAFKQAWCQIAGVSGAFYIAAPQDRRQARELVQAGATAAEVPAKVAAWGKSADKWTREHNFPFSAFARVFNQIRATPAVRAGCQHTEEKVVETRGTAKCYECVACKVRTWR